MATRMHTAARATRRRSDARRPQCDYHSDSAFGVRVGPSYFVVRRVWASTNGGGGAARAGTHSYVQTPLLDVLVALVFVVDRRHAARPHRRGYRMLRRHGPLLELHRMTSDVQEPTTKSQEGVDRVPFPLRRIGEPAPCGRPHMIWRGRVGATAAHVSRSRRRACRGQARRPQRRAQHRCWFAAPGCCSLVFGAAAQRARTGRPCRWLSASNERVSRTWAHRGRAMRCLALSREQRLPC